MRTISYLNKEQIIDDLFTVYYSVANTIHNFRIKMKRNKATAVSVKHSVRKLGNRGRFILVECLNCKERNLAADKNEAEQIYTKLPCYQ